MLDIRRADAASAPEPAEVGRQRQITDSRPPHYRAAWVGGILSLHRMYYGNMRWVFVYADFPILNLSHEAHM